MRIGVFDSGVGGLTVLRAIRDRFPRVNLIYVGDTARVPYGNRSPRTVIRYSIECASFLIDRGIDVLVVACNTASSHAIPTLKERFSLPVVGVVEPGVREALKVTRGRVGVIGTLATVRSGTYQRILSSAGVRVFSKACPLFVPLVEERLFEGEIAESVARMYLEEFRLMGIDTLILGCTHYPLLRKTIQKVLPGVRIVDSSSAVAAELAPLVGDGGEGGTELYFTDRSQNLEDLIEVILGFPVEPVILSDGVSRISPRTSPS